MGKETAIRPEAYARWRESELGARTESLEKEAVFTLAGNLAGLRVLDVGCGDGAYPIHAARLGATVTGLDISPAMLDAARRHASAAGVSVEWREGRAEALLFEPASFDVVIAVTVLCWVTDRAAAVQEMARVLRPGGIVVIGELGRYSLWALAREAHFWTTDELRHLVQSGHLEFGAVRGGVYYQPSRLVAKWLVPLDSLLSRISPVGAAFLCVRADKPSPGSAREGLATSSLHSSS
ncbi:MAG TPA: class I SAM-dependent methyltransferase [Solibacterales bacterium]|nr:class I SAM-dependent methyltransferase [Bryobacterales bacterium]